MNLNDFYHLEIFPRVKGRVIFQMTKQSYFISHDYTQICEKSLPAHNQSEFRNFKNGFKVTVLVHLMTTDKDSFQKLHPTKLFSNI